MLEGERYRDVMFEGRPRPRRRPAKPVCPPWRPVRRVPSARPAAICAVPEDAARFLRLAMHHAGLDGRHYRPAPLLRRLPACLRKLRAGSLPEAEQLLAAEPWRWPVALDALLIGVTGFFRDAQVFGKLRGEVLPALLEQRPEGVRVWSAACSDGAELYSIAMLLAELGALPGSRLLGADCRPAAIERARAGRYPREMLEAVPEDLRERYCRVEGTSMVVAEELRAAVKWQLDDVLGESGPLQFPRTHDAAGPSGEVGPSVGNQGVQISDSRFQSSDFRVQNSAFGVHGSDCRSANADWQAMPTVESEAANRELATIESWKSHEWDLISCRNLTIYLDPASVAGLWAGFERALRPGGVLVAGKAERPGGKLRRLDYCIYIKTSLRELERTC